MDDVDEEMPLNEAIYVEDPLEFPQAIPQEPKSPQIESVRGGSNLLRPILIPDTEEISPTKDPTPVKSTMRKCSSLQPVTLHSHEFLFNTSLVYKNAAGELEIASPPERRLVTSVLDDQLTRVSLSPQPEELDDEFFVASTPEDKIPRAATKPTTETTNPVIDAFISPLAASPQVRNANSPQEPRLLFSTCPPKICKHLDEFFKSYEFFISYWSFYLLKTI